MQHRIVRCRDHPLPPGFARRPESTLNAPHHEQLRRSETAAGVDGGRAANQPVPMCCVRLPDVLDDSTSRTQANLVSFPPQIDQSATSSHDPGVDDQPRWHNPSLLANRFTPALNSCQHRPIDTAKRCQCTASTPAPRPDNDPAATSTDCIPTTTHPPRTQPATKRHSPTRPTRLPETLASRHERMDLMKQLTAASDRLCEL